MPDYEVTGIEEAAGQIRIRAGLEGTVTCPHCGSSSLRIKDRRIRRLRHENWGIRHSVIELETRKWRCREGGRSFWQRFPDIQPRRRATEPFGRAVCQKHFDGISRSRLAEREQLSRATIERWFLRYLELLAGERRARQCPQILGIDEHFFSRRRGYATTFCDLKNHKVYDVVAGRSEAALESYLERLEGKQQVKLVCMDLAPGYRALVRKHFRPARIVADRFHVIRTLNHHFLSYWKNIDPAGARLSEYLSHWPALESIYRFKQRLAYLLLEKGRNQAHCRKLAHRFLRDVAALRCCGLAPLMTLGDTLHA